MKKRSLAAWLSLPIVLIALAAGAQTIPVEVEAGYRWTDVEGNEDLYRTQVNEQSGFVLRSLSFFTNGGDSGAFDHFRLTAVDLSRGPASAVRIDAGKAHAYRLRVGYRSFDAFSALPAFANPLIGQGIVPGQHTWDRERNMFDAELEFLPFGDKFIPFVGYGYAKFDGPGTTTYTLGGDDFRLDSDLEETEHEFRIGAGFNLGKVYGTVTQGWRSFESADSFTLSAGAGAGNNTNAPLGRNVTAGSITRTGETEGETPFTSLSIASQPISSLRLTGAFSLFDAESDSLDDETAAGNFLSFPLARFYQGLDETTTSDANNRTWRGNVRAEYSITDRFELMAGYRRENREMSGTALIDSLFLNSISFGGGSTSDFHEILEAESAMDRSLDEIEAGASYRVFERLVFRVGVSQTDYELEMTPDLEEIVVPGSQAGVFERSVNGLEASALYSDEMFAFTASYRRDDADDPVFRTDFVDRNRWRARFGFTSPGRMFNAGITAEESDQDNETEGAGFDANSREYTIDAELAPWERFRIRGAYSQLRLDSEISWRRPETFALDISRHEEDWGAMELGVAMIGDRIGLDLSAARLENEGTLPYIAHRYRARATFDFKEHVGIAGEWAQDQYDEEAADWGYFQGNRYGIFLRYRP